MMRAFGLKRRLVVGFALAWGVLGGPSWAGTDSSPTRSRVIEGYRLFLTDWSTEKRPGLPGDGLGPVFNEKSCVACHNQGGTGGAGGSRFDVLIVTNNASNHCPSNSDGTGSVASDLFPGLMPSKSLVMHQSSTNPAYPTWRSKVLLGFGLWEDGQSSIARSASRIKGSRRNTPALFGSGLIDAIPDKVLVDAARRHHPGYSGVKGRVARLSDGRIGRFGWKAQTATLGDFVRSACANELGLENPGHSQASDPLRPDYKAPGIDLTDAECTSLTAYIASLPPPVGFREASAPRREHQVMGRKTFTKIGCANCHSPELGDVKGIYSDLLLHDMGGELDDTGTSYGSTDSTILVKANEWRTPPLWGLRDSAPYLHDGRAETIAHAIVQHGGEAKASATLYRSLGPLDKRYLDEFLLSLTSPSQSDLTEKGPTP